MEIKIERKAGLFPSREQLLELYADAGWAAYTREPDRLERAVRQSLAVYTAWDGERLVGLIRAVGDGETILYVQDILVLGRYQRQGIGRALVAALKARAAQAGLAFVTLEARASNAPAIALYEGAGFRRVGVRRNFYTAPTEDAVLMTLYLKE